MKKRILALAILSAAATSTTADDIEIYMQSGIAGSTPLVMFHIEFTPNLVSTICNGVTGQDVVTLRAQCPQLEPLAGYFLESDIADGTISLFEMMRAALKKVMTPISDIKVGFMMSHANDNKCAGPKVTGCSNGGYILKGFTPLDTGKAAVFSTLDAIPEPKGNTSHPNQNKEVYFELFRYLTGQEVYNGRNGWTDFGTDANYNLGDSLDVSPTVPNGTELLKWDGSIISVNGKSYISPLKEDCSKVFVINILDGSGNSANDSDPAISASLADGGMGFAVSNNDPGFVQMVRWMYDRDLTPNLTDKQNVTSYFIAKQPQQVDAAAAAGGTGYALRLSEDPAEMIEMLENMFKQILSVSTTFVSASIPVNVFNRAEVLDNVFIALFQAEGQPRWMGDIKKLKLSVEKTYDAEGNERDVNTIRMIDALGNPAISPTDGRIQHSALTFWTDPTGFDVQDADLEKEEVPGRDGRSVNRGGAGQHIPGFLTDTPSEKNAPGSRQLFTEVGGKLAPLNADAATAASLWPELSYNENGNWDGSDDLPTGDWSADASRYWRDGLVTLEEEAVRLLRFIRGFDVNDEDNDGSTIDSRRWLFGDPLHSRPLPLNFGGENTVRLIVGSNDGFLRMIRNTDGAGKELGTESWAFMPRPSLRIQKQLMDNRASSSPMHPYGVDGAPAAYVKDSNQDGVPEKVYVFFGMRRGGAAYYALEIDPVNPDNTPSLLWSITDTGDFAELGLSFSTPKVKMLDYGSGPKPVVIFAGGYDRNKDVPGLGTNDTKGNALFIVDAETGNLVWKAVRSGVASSSVYVHSGLLDSIPSDVAAVDTTGDRLVDRIYVGDTGGVVWRADIAGNDRTKWSITPILSVGRHFQNTEENDRRFFHAPDVVLARDTSVFDAVVIGSGNRAHPLDTKVVNWMYMFKDRNTVSGVPPLNSEMKHHSDLQDISSNCLQDAVSCPADFDLTNGWRLQLEDRGEKSLASPLTLTGTIYFSTYVPRGQLENTCVAEGTGWIYAVTLLEGKAVFNYTTENDTAEGELFKDDRRRRLDSPGIPSENNYLAHTNEEGDTARCVLTSDFTCENTGQKAAWKTFWHMRN